MWIIAFVTIIYTLNVLVLQPEKVILESLQRLQYMQITVEALKVCIRDKSPFISIKIDICIEREREGRNNFKPYINPSYLC